MKEDTIIIIGGLSAGPSAAAKARRINEKAKILLFEKTEYVSYATCGIPYSLSGKIKTPTASTRLFSAIRMDNSIIDFNSLIFPG